MPTNPEQNKRDSISDPNALTKKELKMKVALDTVLIAWSDLIKLYRKPRHENKLFKGHHVDQLKPNNASKAEVEKIAIPMIDKLKALNSALIAKKYPESDSDFIKHCKEELNDSKEKLIELVNKVYKQEVAELNRKYSINK